MHIIFELNRELSLYYLFFHLLAVLLGFFILSKKSKLFIFEIYALLFLLIFGYSRILYPFFSPDHKISTESNLSKFKLVYGRLSEDENQNLWLYDATYDQNPELIALSGSVNQVSKRLLDKNHFPFFIVQTGKDGSGVALYSKNEFFQDLELDFGERVLVVNSQRNGSENLKIILMNIQISWDQDETYEKKITLKRMASYFRQHQENVILLGNFGTTPFTWDYQQFQNEGQFSDASYGFGLNLNFKKLFSTEISLLDHLLYAGQLSVIDYKNVTDRKSQEEGVVVTFGVK